MRRESKLPLILAVIALIFSLYAILHNQQIGGARGLTGAGLAGIGAGAETTRPGKTTESTFDRVMRTGTIRCGYLVYDPYLIKDPNTGEFSGIFYDIMAAIAKNADLKIEWSEESGYESIFTGLDSGRYDVFCGGLWPNTMRAKAGGFSEPAFFSVVLPWVREDEKKIKNVRMLNSTDIRISVIDGAQEDIIARTDFPLAQRVSMPSTVPFTDNFMNVATGKADSTFAEPSGAKAFIAANPNSLRQLSSEPLRVFGNVLVFRQQEPDFKSFLDQAILELVYSKEIERIVKKYEKYPGIFMLPNQPYQDHQP